MIDIPRFIMNNYIIYVNVNFLVVNCLIKILGTTHLNAHSTKPSSLSKNSSAEGFHVDITYSELPDSCSLLLI